MRADELGLFKPFTHRMAKATKAALIAKFSETGDHTSPTGYTARLIVEHCLTNRLPFSVSWHLEPIPHYLVRLEKD